ncbi:MAG: O-antigen ligase family protein [Candidatus Omnitrophica bacterium]|nr:O-antigen ligase family protein [Candidatus Omnitrophota bacterium]
MRLNQTIKMHYERIYPFLFLFYFFCLFSFGRSFSILYIPTPWLPVFITEIFLLCSLPYLIFNVKRILDLPKWFAIIVGLFWAQAGVHFINAAIIHKNPFALRDIVFSVYPVIFFLTFMVFREQRYWKYFFVLVLIGNVISIVLSRFFCLTQPIFTDTSMVVPHMMLILSTNRGFHLAFFLGMGASFITGFYFIQSNKFLKWFLIFLAVLDYYQVVSMTCRAAWIAMGVAVILTIWILKKQMTRKWGLILGFSFLCCAGLYYVDYMAHGERAASVSGKAKSLVDCSKTQIYKLANTILPKNCALLDQKASVSQNVNDNKDLQLSDKMQDISVATAKWRYFIWNQSIEFGMTSPIWGKGFGVYPKYHYNDGSLMAAIKGYGLNSGVIPSHNFILAVFYKMGFIGLLLFMGIWIYVFYYSQVLLKVYQVRSLEFSIVIGVFLSLVWWFFMGLFSDMIESPTVSVILWFLVGLLFSVKIPTKMEPK